MLTYPQCAFSQSFNGDRVKILFGFMWTVVARKSKAERISAVRIETKTWKYEYWAGNKTRLCFFIPLLYVRDAHELTWIDLAEESARLFKIASFVIYQHEIPFLINVTFFNPVQGNSRAASLSISKILNELFLIKRLIISLS